MTSIDEKSRLFIAVPLAPELRGALADHLGRSRPNGLPGRVVAPESWHLTLRFLGEVDPPRAAALVDRVGASKLPPGFRIRFSGYGAFPRESRARVLWLGVADGAGELVRLAELVEVAARAAGFPPETRPFRPHLTLSRLRRPEDIRDLLRQTPAFDSEMPVREVVLFRSRLGEGPARYERVETWTLEG